VKSLGIVGWGFLLVLLDLNLEHFDVIPDVVGWLMCLAGLGNLPRAGWFFVARLGAATGLVSAAAAVVDAPYGWFIQTGDFVAQLALVVGICAGVQPLLADDRHRATARAILMASVLIDLAALVLVMLSGGDPSDVAPIVLPLAIAALAVAIWFLVFLRRLSRIEPAGAST
jgi:hypothetical protein